MKFRRISERLKIKNKNNIKQIYKYICTNIPDIHDKIIQKQKKKLGRCNWVDRTPVRSSPQGSSPHSPINDKKVLTLVKKVKLLKNKQKSQAIKIKISPLVI